MPDAHDERGGGCVFCAIVAGAAPVTIVREWHDAIAFVPLGPVVPGGHILVVPRRHVADAVEDPAVTAATMAHAAELAAEHEASNILTSIGRAATQSIFHLHVHVIRRAVGDQLMVPWGTTGDPQAPHSCKRSARAEKQLIAERDAANERAEKAEAGILRQLRAAFAAGWHARSAATNGALAAIGWDEREKAAKDWVRGFANNAEATDAPQDGRSEPVERSETSGGHGEGSNSRAGTAGLSEAEPPRDTSAWCWAPNPNGPLCCGRLRDHEPPHRRGERTWTDDTTEDGQ